MKRALVIFSLVIIFFLIQTFYRAGQFKTITNTFQGSVTDIYTQMPGPEDLQVDPVSQRLFIAASERRYDDKSANGIYVLPLNGSTNPAKLSTDYQGEFNPHGISLLRKDSLLYLFAINHAEAGEFIESFLVQENFLKHRNTLSNSQMCCPNDLVAIDLDKLYVSNDHGVKAGIGRLIEDYLKIPRASIFYYDGKEMMKIAKPFHYANGINVSPDGSRLYLAETTGNAITTFDILEDGSLLNLGSFDAGTGVDNIDIDSEGNLWVAAHPKLLDFVKHTEDSLNLAPSQVLKLSPTTEAKFEMELIYQNTGEELSASSGAVYYNNELFIGVVFNRSLLRAKLD